MANTTRTIPGSKLAALMDSHDRGTISLLGDDGGLSLITGEISPSGLVMGTLSIETEHGTVYLDPDGDIRINEETGSTLAPDDFYAINDNLSELLSNTFGWQVGGCTEALRPADESSLDDLTHKVAILLDDFLAASRKLSEGLAETDNTDTSNEDAAETASTATPSTGSDQ